MIMINDNVDKCEPILFTPSRFLEQRQDCKMVMFGLIIALAILCAFVVTAPPVTQTTCGPVAGLYQDGAYSFRGIPYAEPPIGPLRWKQPRLLSKTSGTCWNGTLIAQKYGNTCYQRSPYDPTKYDGSEDCLYLNVFTPTLDVTARKPVMVWLHGCSLQCSSGDWPLYSPTEKLAKDTDIVYVGLNYRLHAFGFLALQILADDSSTKTSGNYGFMDMLAVLQWIQMNIENFGGDPKQVHFSYCPFYNISIHVLILACFCI